MMGIRWILVLALDGRIVQSMILDKKNGIKEPDSAILMRLQSELFRNKNDYFLVECCENKIQDLKEKYDGIVNSKTVCFLNISELGEPEDFIALDVDFWGKERNKPTTISEFFTLISGQSLMEKVFFRKNLDSEVVCYKGVNLYLDNSLGNKIEANDDMDKLVITEIDENCNETELVSRKYRGKASFRNKELDVKEIQIKVRRELFLQGQKLGYGENSINVIKEYAFEPVRLEYIIEGNNGKLLRAVLYGTDRSFVSLLTSGNII